MKDEVFVHNPHPATGSFAFDGTVARAFDDMAERSIPLYRELQAVGAELAKSFVPDGGVVYDIGCSTGAGTLAIAAALEPVRARYVAVDSSAEMLEICRSKLASAGIRAELRQTSALDLRFDEPASLVVCNYLLQFLPIEERKPLLERIFAALTPGGALLISEKCRGTRVLDELYAAFKERNGYSRAEIEAKKRALENVLIPLSIEENEALLRGTGFEPEVVMKAYQFTTWVCEKPHPRSV